MSIARKNKVDELSYKEIFDLNKDGEAILDDLIKRFMRNPYVQGGQEAERESCYRAGQNSVIQHILKQINRADGVDDEPTQDDDDE